MQRKVLSRGKQMELQTVKLSQIKPNPDNPRVIRDEEFQDLVKSIKNFPEMLEAREIVVNKDMMILGGNQRFRALQEAGIKEAKIKIVDWSEDKQREFIIKDNVQKGEHDWDKLANEWDADELEDWGLDLPDSWAEPEEVLEDEAPEVQDDPVSELGKIYQLGKHRVMCGDSTDLGAITDLLDGADTDLILTDPPYGMNAVSGSGVLTKTYGKDIIGDDDTEVAYKSFEATRELNAEQEVWWGANYYSSVLPDSECWIVWNKNNGGSDQTDAELAWGNMRSVVRMFTQSSEKTNRVHPTQKPVELSVWIFNKFNSGDNVLDLFLGSGSTLIACEQTDRICYGMELDPKYVDVIRKRYAKFVHPDTWEERWQELTPEVK